MSWFWKLLNLLICPPKSSVFQVLCGTYRCVYGKNMFPESKPSKRGKKNRSLPLSVGENDVAAKPKSGPHSIFSDEMDALIFLVDLFYSKYGCLVYLRSHLIKYTLRRCIWFSYKKWGQFPTISVAKCRRRKWLVGLSFWANWIWYGWGLKSLSQVKSGNWEQLTWLIMHMWYLLTNCRVVEIRAESFAEQKANFG